LMVSPLLERKDYLKRVSISLHPTKGMFLLDTPPQ
jgi:hypothetical protein